MPKRARGPAVVPFMPKKELRGQTFDPVNVFSSGIPEPFPFADFSEAYAVHVWVYACVRAIATAGSSVDILPYIQDQSGKWSLAENDKFHALLAKPNPYMTGRFMREFALTCIALTGNAYWAKETLGGKEVKELWPLPVGSVKPVSSAEKFVEKYVYTVNGREITYGPEEIIHFRDTNPISMHYGQGSIAPIANAIISDLNAITWNKYFFKNGARLDGVLETDQSLTEDNYNRTVEGWRKLYTGAENSGKTAVLDSGLKYKKIVDSLKDMDFVGLRKSVRDEILAAFNVPPSIVGLLEFANYSNMKEQQKTFWVNTVIPKLISMSEVITMHAESTGSKAGVVFEPDTSTVEALRANETERATTTKTYVDAGIPVNQVIRALDLPFEEVDGGDEPRAAGAVPAQAGNAPSDQPSGKRIKALDDKAVDLVEEQKFEQWKRFDRALSRREDAMEGSMRSFFKGQHRRVSRDLDSNAGAITIRKAKTIHDTIRLLFDIDAENELMKKAAGRHISGTYFEFAVATARRAKPEFEFNLKDPAAEAWIEAKKIKLVQEANAFTLEEISDAVVEGVEQAVAGGFSDSETIAQIADRIDEVYRFAVEGRSVRIARTEVISAANAGALEGMEKTGIAKKSWLSSRDARVRESHKAMEEIGPIGIREVFVSPVTGEKLLFPGDPSAAPSEIVNCRCAILSEE